MGKRNIVAIDVGFGDTKAIDSEGNILKMPSEFCVYNHTSKEAQTSKNIEDMDGNRYLVGSEVAKRRQDAEKLNSVDRLIHYAPLFVTAVSRKISLNRHLAIGLPLTDIKRGSEMKRRLKQFYPDTDIVVCAQGMGCALDVGIRDSIILDIGYNTIDIYVADNGKVIPDECISIEGKGLIWAVERLWKHVIENHKIDDVTYGQVEAAIKGDNHIKKHGKPIDIQKDIDTILESWSRMLLTIIKTGSWARRLDKVEKIVLAGGGAYHVNLRDVGKDMVADRILKPDKPEFSNVRGFLKIADRRIK